MSDYDENDQQFDGPANLRKAYEKAQQELREERERVNKLEERMRQRELRDEIGTRELDPRVVDLIPKDADVSEWLGKYGDLFGAKAPETSEEAGESGPTQEEIDGLREQQAADRGFRPGNESDDLAKINGAESYDDLVSIIKKTQRQ